MKNIFEKIANIYTYIETETETETEGMDLKTIKGNFETQCRSSNKYQFIGVS